MREISTEVTEDVSQLTHGAVSVCRGNGDFSECRAGQLQFALKLRHHGSHGSTGLCCLDTAVCHETDCLGNVLCRIAEGTGNRSAVLESLAHHGDIGVSIGGCRCEDVRKVTGVLCCQSESGECIGDDVRGRCEVFTGSGGEGHDTVNAGEHILGLPSGHRHIVHGGRSF